MHEQISIVLFQLFPSAKYKNYFQYFKFFIFPAIYYNVKSSLIVSNNNFDSTTIHSKFRDSLVLKSSKQETLRKYYGIKSQGRKRTAWPLSVLTIWIQFWIPVSTKSRVPVSQSGVGEEKEKGIWSKHAFPSSKERYPHALPCMF